VSKLKIGIPRALLYYRYGILWKTFFESLGFETVLSPKTNKQIMDAGDQYTVDENCISSKLFFGHIAALEGRCDAVFVPRIANLGTGALMCSRFEALYDMSRNIFRSHDLDFLTCNVDVQQGISAKTAYIRLGEELGATRGEAEYAYRVALSAQAEEIRRKIREAEELTKRSETKVLICGHPYNMYDEYIGVPVLRGVRNLHAIPICTDAVDLRKARADAPAIAPYVPWVTNREQLGAIRHFRKHVDGIILMTAFPCGPDSMVNEMIIRMIGDKPVLNLLLDAQSGNAGIETRLESFIDIIRFRKKVTL
jgi:predicted nucleotide-binding protein (sugar kinase/HSP70/actin superfamily)